MAPADTPGTTRNRRAGPAAERSPWPPGDGEMARRVRVHDWAATPLGPIAEWPQSLRTAVEVVLGSGHAMQLAWGPERTVLYNDAYAPMLAGRHPGALGLPFREAWPDIWDEIAPLVERVFAGGTVRFEELPLVMTRRGHPEDTWWDFSYSPVRDESGAVAGLLNVTVDATGRVRAERAERERDEATARLRENEARFRTLAETAPALIWQNDASGENLFINRRFLDYTGKSAAEIGGEGWRALVHPDDAEAYIADYMAAVRERRAWQNRNRIRRRDGSFRWFENYAQPLFDADGRYAGHVGVSTDVTASVLAEKTLRESEERTAFLLKLSDALGPLADAAEIQAATTRLLGAHLGVDRAMYAEVEGEPGAETGTIRGQYVRPARGGGQPTVPFPERFGYWPFGERAMARRYRGELLVVADIDAAPGFEAAERAAWAAAGVRAAVVAPLAKGGRLVAEFGVHSAAPRAWTEAEASLVREVAERTWAAVERARAEAALRESEARFRTLAETAPALIWRNDAEGGNVFVNRHFLEFTGKSAEAIRGGGWHALVHPDEAEAYVADYLAAVRDRRAWQNRNRIRRHDGAWRWFENYARPLFGEDGRYLGHVGVSTDVTAAAEAAGALRESEERNALLVRFSDEVRGLSDPALVAEASCRILTERLGTDRTLWAAIDRDAREYVAEWAFLADGTRAEPSRWPLDPREPFAAEHLAGRPVVYDDSGGDPRIPGPAAAAMAERGLRAGIAVPVMAAGTLRAVLNTSQPTAPRRWRPEEVAFVEALAGRAWAEIERARAEAALRESEARQAFLLALGDAMRAQPGANAVIEVAARLLGERLDASRVMFAEFDHARGVADVFHGWFADGAQPFPVAMPLADYDGPILDDLRAGRTVRVDDAGAPPAGRPDLAAIAEVGVLALLSVPLVVGGRLAVNLSVHQHAARRWTDDEVALVREVAERLWADLVRARAEAALRDSEGRFRTLAEAIEDVFYMTDLDRGALLYLSPAYERVWGRPAAELLADVSRFPETLHPDDLPARREAQAARARGGPAAVEYRILRPDGEVRWILDRSFPVRGVEGRVTAGIATDVTERKRAEVALRESETRLAATLEALPVGVGVVDADGAYVLSNQAMDRFVSTKLLPSRDEAQGWRWRAWHPDGRRVEPRDYPGARALRGDRVVPGIEFLHTAHDGREVWTEVASVPLKDAAGRVTGVVTVVSDIDAAKRSAEALRASEGLFRGFAENSADVLWIVDAGGRRLEYLSPAFERVFGEPRDRIMADLGRWREMVHSEDRDAASAFLPRVLAGEVAIAHYRLVRPADGRAVHLRDTGFPIRDAAGAVARVAGIVQDVTDIVLATEALEAEKQRFRVLAEGIPQLVWRSAEAGEWTWAGPQWEAFTGLSAEASLGRGWLEALHPDDRAAALAAWAAAGTGGVFQADYRVRHAPSGRHVWFQTRGLPVRGEGGKAIEWLGASTDIDDQVRAREVLARVQEELEARVTARTAELMAAEESLRQSQKMEAVGQLTGGIAHDFNNMLQGVAGGLEMARRRVAEGRDDEARRYLDAARGAVDRAAGLTRRLLAFARRQRLEPKPVEADALVAGMADLVRRTAGPGVEVQLRLCNGAWSVLCDANELESAVLNLCINARDAMPDGGQLRIATREARVSAAEAAGQEGAAAGDYVAVSVSDTGTGMPPEVLGRVFEPFFTTKPLGQGTGLGLSQIHGFVRQSGGFVRIESAPGRGTTVSLFLPKHARAGAPTDEEAAPPPPEHAGAAGGATVLLVDDEAAARGPAAERLRELGHRVLEAADGPAALRLLADGARIDLLVTDVGLPGGMNGRQVAEAVRERAPGVPVLFITGYAANTPLPPGTEVVGKPFELDALARRVQALLGANRADEQRTPRPRSGVPRA